jgi:hypothetical protein
VHPKVDLPFICDDFSKIFFKHNFFNYSFFSPNNNFLKAIESAMFLQKPNFPSCFGLLFVKNHATKTKYLSVVFFPFSCHGTKINYKKNID